ncbi:MAG: Rrf2 family transcriptional regulator [Deltaproteobacteria bacterium]|jgi:Rrf2 family protein|nr:Rrf2 family transcriptional regulator [Deltaproteobacteria bacterium]
MKLSAKTRYAARILLDLARHDKEEPVPATRLSQHTGVSVQFIEQILKPLKQAGLTRSARGASGGHSLARNPDEITLAEVVSLMEGGLHLALCTDESRAVCESSDFCSTRTAWTRVSTALSNELADISLQDLLDDYRLAVIKAGNVEIFPVCRMRLLQRKGRPPKSGLRSAAKAMPRPRRKS